MFCQYEYYSYPNSCKSLRAHLKLRCPAQRGEYPDKKSKGLQQLAQDFGSACESVGKTLGKKNRDVATTMKAYDKAAELLTSYLKGTELDPLGSESYN